MRLPTDAAERKGIPVFSGCFAYFPDALVAVAELSRIGNDQHNPGKPLFWDRSKSSDELDALARHLLDCGTLDTDGVRHSTKVAWRALANLQKEIENESSECSNNDCSPGACPCEDRNDSSGCEDDRASSGTAECDRAGSIVWRHPDSDGGRR